MSKVAEEYLEEESAMPDFYFYPSPDPIPEWADISTAPEERDVERLFWASLTPDGKCFRTIGRWFQAGDDGWWVANALRIYPRMWQDLPKEPDGEA